jgi:hypothetical protein
MKSLALEMLVIWLEQFISDNQRICQDSDELAAMSLGCGHFNKLEGEGTALIK